MKTHRSSSTPLAGEVNPYCRPPPSKPPRLLEIVDVATREEILSHCRRRRFEKNDVIFRQGEAKEMAYIIESGRVKTYFLFPDGRSITFAYWSEGIPMGVGGLSAWGRDWSWSCEAVMPTTLLSMDLSFVNQLARRSSSLAQCLLEVMEFKAAQLRTVIRLLAAPSVMGRLQVVLLSLADVYGCPTEFGTLIDGRFTHFEIADMVGASRQRVTSLLGKLRSSGVIHIERRLITVRKNRLNEISWDIL